MRDDQIEIDVVKRDSEILLNASMIILMISYIVFRLISVSIVFVSTCLWSRSMKAVVVIELRQVCIYVSEKGIQTGGGRNVGV